MKAQAVFQPSEFVEPTHRQAWEDLVAPFTDADPLPPCYTEIAATLQHIGVEDSVVLAGVYYYAEKTASHPPIPPPDVAVTIASAREYDRLKQKLTLPAAQSPEVADNAQAMMLLESMQDMRAIFVVLAERLCVLRHLKSADDATQLALARETFALYVPVANRLGLGTLKWELEDQSFRYLFQDIYKDIARRLDEKRGDRETYIAQVVARIKIALAEAGIAADVYGRPKHIYSIWRKMQRKDKAFYDIYDVRAIRILVDTVEECYAALSVVHNLWEYIPGEYDDYIAAPKSNHYQSLHTAVRGPQDKNVEIQIRTRTMHEYAENGLAAHWRYKEGEGGDGDAQRVDWLRKIVQQSAMYDTEMPRVAPANRVYVLSPKGKVLDLPVGATPLDYAYLIHTDLGHRCRGAKVNGKMVPLNTALHSGQQVEIIAGKEPHPSRDWLLPQSNYLASTRARAKVRQWFKTQFRSEHIAQGKSTLARELTRLRLDAVDADALAKRFNLVGADDLYAAIGRGDIGVLQVSHVLVEPVAHPHEAPPAAHVFSGAAPPLDIMGVDNLMTGIARCCKPLPGEEVRGFITKGRGVVLHRRSCNNFRRLAVTHPERVVDVNWGVQGTAKYETDIVIVAQDRAGLLRDVTAVVTGAEINVLAANTYTDRRTLQARMMLTLEVADRGQLQSVLDKVVQVKGVLEARRVE